MATMISMKQRVRAEKFLNDAEKTLKKSTWFSSSTEQKYEDAAELYDQAANAYKVGQMNSEAGVAYMKAAELYRDKLSNQMEGSKALSNAGSCLKKVNAAEAVKAYNQAVSLLCDAGRLNQAAKLSKQIAEMYENDSSAVADESVDPTVLAIESYQQASDLFEMENAKSQASQCKAKVAELSSAQLDPPDLLKGAEIYENLGRECLENNLLKYNAKGYFLQSCLCHLANGDAIAASQSMSRFESLDFTFGESREGKFVSGLIEAIENFDSESFATICFEFDRISKLDPWKTSMLVKVKRSIDDQSGDVGQGADDGDDVDLT
mmetsp:Transcript_40303/g.47154  ORF Transcript_40303/g.47154 Transcript_40303/m.47154 type:complete len:321 (+) Transcript_40303:108-1070(+)|eukprot:CAMPEP_0194372170 /NCGR_PEP_ID=MMETSP0174-20130528/20482_1 /TAXON_ID=216777 /ORGANISM="Proboscia alata, Strain PI-D3" /LENGTH=320 /DNA_ID=CAMNT_0039150525 /DNA_START=91 /DNA_END=1053 /DNA_ORIENTATION=+